MSSRTPAICWCSVPFIGARRGSVALIAMSSKDVPALRIANGGSAAGAHSFRGVAPTAAAFDLHRTRRRRRQVRERLALAWALELLARLAMAGQVKIIQHQLALEKLDRLGRIDALGTRPRTLAGIVAAESASRSRRDRVASAAAFIARVLVVALRRGQRHRAEIARVGCQRRAGAHAASALDAVAELEISL